MLVLLQNLKGNRERRNSARASTARGMGVDPIISVPEMSMSNARMIGLALAAIDIVKVGVALLLSDAAMAKVGGGSSIQMATSRARCHPF